MSGAKKVFHLLPYFGVVFLITLWVIHVFNLDNTHGLIADEFIYLNQNHLGLSYLDFFLYNPKDFFGHGPLLPLIHKILFQLGSGKIIFLRGFHILICLGIPFLIWFEKRRLSYPDILLTTLFLFHPLILAQAPLLYPEILQGLLAGLSFLLWKKERKGFLCFVLLLNTLLRETSLIFTFTLFLMEYLKARDIRKTIKSSWVFLPSFVQIIIHLILLYITNAWNPGWVEYSSAGESIEFNMLIFSLKWLFSPLGGQIFIPFLLLFPLFQLPFFKNQFKAIMGRPYFWISPFLLFLIFLSFLVFLEIESPEHYDPWVWFHRVSHLGITGSLFFLLFGVLFQPTSCKKKDWFYWTSSFSFFLFFLWYQAHSARDLLPLLTFFILSFAGKNWANKRDLRGVLPIFLLFIHLGQFYKNQNKNFLSHSLSLLSPQQKANTYKKEVQFLDRVKLIKAPIKADHNGLSYLSNPSLSPKTLTLQPEADLVISMNPQLEAQNENEKTFKMIDKGEALYLYMKN